MRAEYPTVAEREAEQMADVLVAYLEQRARAGAAGALEAALADIPRAT
jgi:hypothetical protein